MADLTISLVRCINNSGYEGSLDVGEIYRTLPTSPIEDAVGDIRVIDNEGEDYLYKKAHFELVNPAELKSSYSFSATTHLDGITGILVRDEARARGVSVSALLREWIDERLDLPVLQ